MQDNERKEIVFQPIGIVHTPFNAFDIIPKQPAAAEGVEGYIEIFPDYLEGIKDLAGFSHIVLLFNFHLSREIKLSVIPFNGVKERGVFSTRSPERPNKIGFSIVRLTSIEGNMLKIRNIDAIDGTPLIDIKPFIPEMDCFDINDIADLGWLAENSPKK